MASYKKRNRVVRRNHYTHVKKDDEKTKKLQGTVAHSTTSMAHTTRKSVDGRILFKVRDWLAGCDGRRGKKDRNECTHQTT
jgi:hypothetical protein